MREPTEAENEAAAEEFYRGARCTSRYNGNDCELDAGHITPHSHWIEGWGDLNWSDEQAAAEHQKVVDYWADRGVVQPPVEEPAPDRLPSRYLAAALVERGFLPSDAEKVEAFARRLMEKGDS